MNAHAPLNIRGEMGHCQWVHPDVVRMPLVFGGYEYWMAATPYPFANSRLENPVIRASHDGYVWEPVAGVPEPLVAAPSDPARHHADTELIFTGDILYLVFMTRHKKTGETVFSAMHTTDGRNWSEPRIFHTGIEDACPTFTLNSGACQMWAVRRDASTAGGAWRIYTRIGSDVFHLGSEIECHMPIPQYVPWHLDVQRTDRGHEALVAAFPVGADNSRTRLFHMVSSNGVEFVLGAHNPLIAPSRFGWDNRLIYRSCFLKDSPDRYRIWYSAASWNLRFGLGYLEGSLDDLRESARCEIVKYAFVNDLLFAAFQWLKYHVGRMGVPKWVLGRIRRLRSGHTERHA